MCKIRVDNSWTKSACNNVALYVYLAQFQMCYGSLRTTREVETTQMFTSLSSGIFSKINVAVETITTDTVKKNNDIVCCLHN